MAESTLRGTLERAHRIARNHSRKGTIGSIDGFTPPDHFGEICDAITEALAQLTELELDHGGQIVNYPHDITTRWLEHISGIKHSARATGKTSPIHNLTSVESILKWWEEEVRPGLIHEEAKDND